MYVRVCACVGQTLLSYARGFPRGPKRLNHSVSLLDCRRPSAGVFLFLSVTM